MFLFTLRGQCALHLVEMIVTMLGIVLDQNVWRNHPTHRMNPRALPLALIQTSKEISPALMQPAQQTTGNGVDIFVVDRLAATLPAALRRLVRETRLHPADFVLPLFVRPGSGVRTPVASMPGGAQTSVDECVKDAERAHALGVGGVILFGIPEHKDATGTGAWDDAGPVQQAVRAIKRAVPDLVVMTDVCLCEYTDHGHCGVIREGDVIATEQEEHVAQDVPTAPEQLHQETIKPVGWRSL